MDTSFLLFFNFPPSIPDPPFRLERPPRGRLEYLQVLRRLDKLRRSARPSLITGLSLPERFQELLPKRFFRPFNCDRQSPIHQKGWSAPLLPYPFSPFGDRWSRCEGGVRKTESSLASIRFTSSTPPPLPGMTSPLKTCCSKTRRLVCIVGPDGSPGNTFYEADLAPPSYLALLLFVFVQSFPTSRLPNALRCSFQSLCFYSRKGEDRPSSPNGRLDPFPLFTFPHPFASLGEQVPEVWLG